MFTVYAFLLNLLLGAALLAPRFSRSVADRVATDPIRTGLIGLGVFVAVSLLLVAAALTVVGLLVGAILSQIPVVGGLINAGIFLLGLGALSSGLYVNRRRAHVSVSGETGGRVVGTLAAGRPAAARLSAVESRRGSSHVAALRPDYQFEHVNSYPIVTRSESMGKYTIHADVTESEFQNVQELAAIWGEIESEVEDQGGELLDAYVVLGSYDFQLVYEADDDVTAMRIALAIERYGMDTRTHQVFDVGELGELSEDI